MTFSGLNWWAVLAAVVANMVLGFLWYGPLFGKSWMALIGKKESDLPQNLAMYVVPILGTLLSALVLFNVMRATGLSGILAGFYMWLGFVALSSYTNDLFEGRPLKLWAIENSQHLVGFLLTGLLLDLLR